MHSLRHAGHGASPGFHDDVIKWKHFPCYRPFMPGIHQSPVNSPHKGQWRAALLFSLICTGINGWLNNGENGDLRRHRPHYDVTVMYELPTLRDTDGVQFYQSNAPSDGVLGMFTGNTTWHHLCKNRQRRTAVRVDFLNPIENRCTLKQ